MSRKMLAGSFVCFLCAAVVAQDKKAVDPAEWAPADAIFYLGVTDTAATWEKFTKSAAYERMQQAGDSQSLSQAGMANMILKKVRSRLAQALSIEEDQLENPFGGPLAMYLIAPPGGAEHDVVAVFVASVGNKDLMKKYFDSAISKLREGASESTTVEAGAATVHVFKSTADAEEDSDDDDEFMYGQNPAEMFMAQLDRGIDHLFSPEGLPPELAVALTDDRLVVSGNIDAAKRALQGESTGRTLADSDDHKTLMRALKPIGTLRVIVNVPRIIEMVRAGSDGDPEFKQAMQAIGADSLRSIVGHWRIGAEAYDSKFDLLFLMSGERSGLAKILSMQNRSTAPPASVGADAVMFFAANIEPPKLLDDIERMVRQKDPAAADQMRSSLEAVPLGPEQTINLRKDVIDHLTGPLVGQIGIRKPYGADAVRALIAIGNRDRDAIARFLGAFPMFTPRDMRGTQVFDFIMAPISLAATNDRVLVGNAPAVDAALDAAASGGLGETDEFRSAQRMVPDEAWLTLYIDERRMMEHMIGLAEDSDALSAAAQNPAAMMVVMAVEEMRRQLPDGDLSHAKKMLKHTSQSIMTVATTPEGVRFTGVEMKPKEGS